MGNNIVMEKGEKIIKIRRLCCGVEVKKCVSAQNHKLY